MSDRRNSFTVLDRLRAQAMPKPPKWIEDPKPEPPIIATGTPYFNRPHCSRQTVGAFACENHECPTNGTEYDRAVTAVLEAAELTADNFPNLWRLKEAVDRYREVVSR